MSDLHRFEMLWSEEAAAALDADRGGAAPLEYARGLVGQVRDVHLYDRVSRGAAEVEPYDPVTGYDPEFLAANAFTHGGVLAVRLAQLYLTPEQREGVYGFELGIETCTDIDDPNYAAKQEVSTIQHMKVAADGWEIAGRAFADLLGDWEDDISPNIRKQVYFRNGFGFIIFLAHCARNLDQLLECEELEDTINTGELDWDAELANMLGDPEA